MIPVRVLLVEESWPLLRELKRQLVTSEGFEVFTAGSPAAGMVGLARYQPDLLVVDPFAGGGTSEEWKQAILRHRTRRPLSVLVLSERLSERDHELLDSLADLGVRNRTARGHILEMILTAWADQGETLRDAV